MSKLMESAEREYEMLRVIQESITSSVIPRDSIEENFIDNVIRRLNIVLELEFDKNNLKRKYYSCRNEKGVVEYGKQ